MSHSITRKYFVFVKKSFYNNNIHYVNEFDFIFNKQVKHFKLFMIMYSGDNLRKRV